MSSSFWCHSCHSIVRIPFSPSLSCPSCGFGFVEEISSQPGLVLLSANSPHRDFPGTGDGGIRDLSGYGSGRSSSSGRGFLRRLFRSSRSSRQASESRTSLLEVLDLLQSSRNTESRNEGGDDTGPRSASLGFPWMNDDGASMNTDNVSGILGINSGDRSAVARTSQDETSDSGLDRPHDDVLAPRPLNVFLQRLISGILQGGRNGSLPASKAAVAAMPTIKISKQSLGSDECGDPDDTLIECAVCKEAFEMGGEVREMPCKHIYHSGCILPWLELHSSCPLCRREMPVDAEDRASSSATSEGVIGGHGGEPTIVFIGISGAGVLVFSFVMLGAGNRTEQTITANQEGEQGTQLSSVAEEEIVEGEPDSERGVEALAQDSGVGSDNMLIDAGNPSEVGEGLAFFSDNTEVEREERDSLGMRREASEAFSAQNDGDIHSSECSAQNHIVQDEAGTTRTNDGTDTWRDRRLNQLVSDTREGASSGSRSRSFFSWFFQHAATRSASTSSATEDPVEGTLFDANSTSEGHHDRDKNST